MARHAENPTLRWKIKRTHIRSRYNKNYYWKLSCPGYANHYYESWYEAIDAVDCFIKYGICY